MSRNLDAVHDRAAYLRPGGNDVRHFARGDVLSLPAKRVANSIHKMEKAAGVAPHQIAAAEPRVAVGDHVAENLALGRVSIRVPVELAFGRGSVGWYSA